MREEDIYRLPGGGGIYNSKNLAVYSYSHNNPVVLIDPDGKMAMGVPTRIMFTDGGIIDYNALGVGTYFWCKYMEMDKNYYTEVNENPSPEEKLRGRLISALIPFTTYEEEINRIVIGLDLSDIISSANIGVEGIKGIVKKKKYLRILKRLKKLAAILFWKRKKLRKNQLLKKQKNLKKKKHLLLLKQQKKLMKNLLLKQKKLKNKHL